MPPTPVTGTNVKEGAASRSDPPSLPVTGANGRRGWVGASRSQVGPLSMGQVRGGLPAQRRDRRRKTPHPQVRVLSSPIGE